MAKPIPYDDVLIGRCQLGDGTAMDELLNQYRAKAFMYAMKMTKHVEDANDVVSEGFIRIHRSIQRFRSNAPFATWMYRILKNCFLDRKKKRTVEIAYSLDEGSECDESIVYKQPVDKSLSTFEIVAKGELSTQMLAALQRLPILHRELILLHYFDELSYDQIAGLLTVPSGTIKSRVHRAKAGFKTILEEDPNFRNLN